LDIQVPLDTDIIVTKDIGSIRINNIKGKTQGKTNVGDIFASNIHANIKLITNVGKVVCEVPEEISVARLRVSLTLRMTDCRNFAFKCGHTNGQSSGISHFAWEKKLSLWLCSEKPPWKKGLKNGWDRAKNAKSASKFLSCAKVVSIT
jgi:hypothetical protein